jgi:hypothetical protein
MTTTGRINGGKILLLIAALGVLGVTTLTPRDASAQPVPPATAPRALESSENYKWLAIGAGAIGGVVVLNIVTGGAALAPLMAAPIVDAGVVAAGAAARQAACRWSAIVSSAIAGGFIGNWYYNR